MARFKEYASRTLADNVSKAMDIILGYPRVGTAIGKGPHAPIPNAYVQGANGWSATVCEVVLDSASGNALVTMPDTATSINQTVRVDGSNVTVNFTTGVVASKPAKYAPKRQVP